jgi:hypothetical protein
MGTNKSTGKTNDKSGSSHNSDAFPEPQAWALNWDDTALQVSSRPKPTNPKSTPNR